MFLTRSEYDRGVNTFSPEGRLFQVEYAIEAIKLGSTTIGIATKEGVVLGVEKRVQSKLLEATSIEKIMEIDTHLGCAMSGLTADARTMIEHARVTSQNHAFTYDEEIKVSSVTQAVCDLALRFGESTEDDEAMMVSFFNRFEAVSQPLTCYLQIGQRTCQGALRRGGRLRRLSQSCT